MKRLRVRGSSFFDKLDKHIERFYASQFFDDIDTMVVDAERERLRQERYRARREANLSKAYRILLRLRRVEAIDLFKMTQHIEPNFFGEKTLQFEEVKRKYEKKARIVWFLTGLYNYLAFDFEGQGWSAKRGFNYSRHRKHYLKMLEQHFENLRQKKWDAKRAKIRARRNKKNKVDPSIQVLYQLRRGMGNHVPMPVPLVDDEIVHQEFVPLVPKHLIEETNWDD